MNSFLSNLVLSVAGAALLALCCSCTSTEQVASYAAEKPTAIEAKGLEARPQDIEPTETRPAAGEPKAKEPVAPESVGQPNVIAEIGDYVITREDLDKRLIIALRSGRDEYRGEAGPVDAKTVLLKMIAEKAMLIDGRKQDYLKDDERIKRFREGKLVALLFEKNLPGKINVTDSEIEEKMKADPKLDRARAKAMIETSKRQKTAIQFYNEICEKRHARKVKFNFPKAAQIHQRLLHRPTKERHGFWIKKWQIDDELTAEEKKIVLATYDNGEVTLKDWFDTLHLISPRLRWQDWKDLNTIQGVERLLDDTMSTPILVAEAKSRGLDKDENYVKEATEQEDKILSNKIRSKIRKSVKEPTKEEIADYFNKHKEKFRTRDTLKIDQIWCQDIKTAEKVKDELKGGRDFKSVRGQYSLEKKGQPFNTSTRKEGIFFEDLWEGEPNQIIGPVKGFYGEERGREMKWQLKWRIVKIVEKKPGKMREYSSDLEREVKNRMQREEREAKTEEYRKELLEKYSYKIYAERLKSIDPFNIP